MINLFQPQLGNEELSEISKVFNSNWIGKGQKVSEFEDKFAKSLKSSSKKFISTTSCTEGIFLSADIFNFCPKDEIIIPTISFPSIGSAVLDSGAKLVFCDVDKHSLNVTVNHIKPHINNRTKALFLTHYGGIPCDMDPLVSLCKKHNIYIIEDSACSVQSFYKAKACGTIGDMGIWSFDAMKTLSTGDGGMIYLKNLDFINTAKERLYLGLPNKSKSGLDSSKEENTHWWEYSMNRTGRRAIMNDITASIGLSQLIKVNSFISIRERIFMHYMENLNGVGDIRVPPMPEFDFKSSYYFFWIQTKYRDNLATYLLERGIYTTFRYWPLHKVDLFNSFSTDDYPESEFASSFTLNLPLHQSLSDDDADKVIAAIKEFYEKL